MNVRMLATALTIASIVGACGVTAETQPAAGQPEKDPAVAAPHPDEQPVSLPDGSIRFPDGMTMEMSRSNWAGDTLEEVAANLELTVLVRATDNSWTAPAPGQPPEEDEVLANVMPGYHWREFEVVDVLSGSYDYDTLNYGGWLNPTTAGETYLLIISILTKNEAGEPRYSDQHFTGPAPPYLLTADNILTTTDPYAYPSLDQALTLAEAHARLGDADGRDQDGSTEPPVAPAPEPSVDEESE